VSKLEIRNVHVPIVVWQRESRGKISARTCVDNNFPAAAATSKVQVAIIFVKALFLYSASAAAVENGC